MALHVACRLSGQRAQQLCSGECGAPIWVHLLEPLYGTEGAADPGDGAVVEHQGNDMLPLLVRAVVVQHGLLEQLMRCLGGQGLLQIMSWQQRSAYATSASCACRTGCAHEVSAGVRQLGA
jgi:hypothetical protein